MRKSLKVGFIFTSIMFVLFITFTILVSKVGIENIGPNNSSVGFSFINGFIFDIFDENQLFDKLSDVVLVVSLLVALSFTILGIYQLIKRKKLSKVDPEILILGGIYILVIISYVLFMFIPVNFRPILVENELELSYPSTHVLVSFTMLTTAFIPLKKYVKNKTLRKIIESALSLLIIASALFRLLSGMHWFTDILGALLLSTTLTSLYISINLLVKEKANQKRTDE